MINNKFYTINAHCHIYPEKIASKAVHSTDNFYGVVSYCKGEVNDLLLEGEKAGVDHFIIQSVATTPKQVAHINEFIAGEVKSHKDKFTGLGTLHPESQDVRGDVEHVIELGLHGIKLHPDIQNFDVDDKRCIKIYEECERFNLPILFHTGDSRYDHSNANRFAPILRAFPNTTMIGAHFGGYSVWEDACEKLRGIPNLYVDCSSSFFKIDKKTALKLIKSYGVDRVMFGTDYPMWRTQTEIDFLLSLDLADEEYSKIFSKNAIKVYNVKL